MLVWSSNSIEKSEKNIYLRDIFNMQYQIAGVVTINIRMFCFLKTCSLASKVVYGCCIHYTGGRRVFWNNNAIECRHYKTTTVVVETTAVVGGLIPYLLPYLLPYMWVTFSLFPKLALAHTLSTADVSYLPGIFPTTRALNAPLVFRSHLTVTWFQR